MSPINVSCWQKHINDPFYLQYHSLDLNPVDLHCSDWFIFQNKRDPNSIQCIMESFFPFQAVWATRKSEAETLYQRSWEWYVGWRSPLLLGSLNETGLTCNFLEKVPVIPSGYIEPFRGSCINLESVVLFCICTFLISGLVPHSGFDTLKFIFKTLDMTDRLLVP